jgi:iron-sulfur cluster assembly accessory protein
MIDLTLKAQEYLLKVQSDNPDRPYVRLGVKGGGCSGFEYSIGLLDQYEPEWNEIEFNSAGGTLRVFIDQLSMMYLDGVTVDFIESLDGTGFKFTNPNVKTACGCGKSFSV